MGEKKRRMAGGGDIPIQMPVLEGFPDHVIERLVDRASDTLKRAQDSGNAHPRWFAEQLNAAEVIVCVYPDEDWNWSAAVVRGIRDILDVLKNTPDAPRAFYVRCWNRYDAEGYWTGFGDGRTKPGTPTAYDITPQIIQLVSGIPVEDRHAAFAASVEDKKVAEAVGLGDGVGRDAWVREAFDADIVWGVWETDSFEGGVGIAMLKGKSVMERVRVSEKQAVVTQTHILCANIGHADTLYRELGEGRAPGSARPAGRSPSFELPVRMTRYAVELMPVLQPDGRGSHQVAVATSLPRRINDDARRGRTA